VLGFVLAAGDSDPLPLRLRFIFGVSWFPGDIVVFLPPSLQGKKVHEEKT